MPEDMPGRMSDRMPGDSQSMSDRIAKNVRQNVLGVFYFWTCFIFRAVEIISHGAPACLCPDRRCADMFCD